MKAINYQDGLIYAFLSLIISHQPHVKYILLSITKWCGCVIFWNSVCFTLNCIHVLNVIWYSSGIIILDFMIMEYRPRKAMFSCLSTWGPLSQFLFLEWKGCFIAKWFLPGMTSSWDSTLPTFYFILFTFSHINSV